MLTAKQSVNGNFTVYKDDEIAFAHIVKTLDRWKVINQVPGRRSSRTFSVSPEQAAQKYFGKKIQFEYLASITPFESPIENAKRDIKRDLLAKLSPSKLRLSAKMRWLLDSVTDQDNGARGPRGESPQMLQITSDGFIQAGSMFIGDYDELKANLNGILYTVEATTDERIVFWETYNSRVTDWKL